MKLKKVTSLLLAVTLVFGMTMTTGCSKKSDKKKTESTVNTKVENKKSESAVNTKIDYKKSDLALTIDDQKYTMENIMFYIYSYESQIDYYDQMYQYYFKTSYWDMEINEETKVTVRQDAKQQAMDTAIRYEILNKEAIKKGYKLSDEEKETVKKNVTKAMSSLTKEQIALTGFTEENITDVQLRWALADKYYADIIDSFKIDKDGIKAGIDKEQYKEYETKCVAIPITKAGDDGKPVPLSDKEKKAAKEKIEAVYKKVKAGTELDKVLGKDEQDLAYNGDMSFLPNDEQETTDKKYMAAAIKLKKGEMSEIVEGNDAYYIIEMVDDNATKSYEEAVKEAISKEESSRFDKEFVNIKANHKVEINNAVWDKVVMGNNTIVAGEDESANAAATDSTAEEGLPNLIGDGADKGNATPTDDATN